MLFHITLFNVASDTRKYSIEYWRDYGITMPDFVTSNGSARMVAEQVVRLVTNYGFKVQPENFDPGNCSDIESLRAKLIDEYKRCQEIDPEGVGNA